MLFEIGDVYLTVGVRHKSNLVPVGGDGGIHLDAVARIGEGFLGATVDIENVELAGEVAVTVIGGALVHNLAVAYPLGTEADAENTFARAVDIDDNNIVHFIEHDFLAIGRELGVEGGAAVEQALVAVSCQNIEVFVIRKNFWKILWTRL